MNNITRETFEGMDTDSKLNVLFDYITEQQGYYQKCMDNVKIQGRINMGIAATMGFVGGLVGFFGRFMVGK